MAASLDRVRLDWLGAQFATVNYHYGHEHWVVIPQGTHPFIGKTLRQAVDRAIKSWEREQKALAKSLKKNEVKSETN